MKGRGLAVQLKETAKEKRSVVEEVSGRVYTKKGIEELND